MKRLVLTLALILLIVLAGCDAISEISDKGLSPVEATVTNIHFSANPRATHVVFDVEAKANGALPDTSYYVCLLSRDGYYFGSRRYPDRVEKIWNISYNYSLNIGRRKII